MAPRIRTALAAATLTAGVAATATLALTPAAAAAPECTAWAQLPSRVAIVSTQTSVPAVLRGSAGCTDQSHDYGATATLNGPRSEQAAYQRWTRFGTAQTLRFLVTADRRGTYVMDRGNVQVYNAGEVRVTWAWHSTSMSVRYGSRFTGVRRGSSLTATLAHYTADGWTRSARRTVALQERTPSGWHSIAYAHTGTDGVVTIGHGLSRTRSYRLLSGSTSEVWGATRTV